MAQLPARAKIPGGPSRHVYDVIVLGGQLGAAMCAALLAKRGYRVLFIEHDGMGPGYTHKGYLLPYAPSLSPPLKTMPLVDEALAELGLNTTVQRTLKQHVPDLQLVLPKSRVDLHHEPTRRLAELEREFAEEGRALHGALAEAVGWHEKSDFFFREKPELPPQGFLEEWSFKKLARRYPGLQAGSPIEGDNAPGRALRSRNESRVIYLGSFSKTFAAGLRVGWVLAPHAVRDKLVMVSEAQVLCPSNLTQTVVAEYLARHPWREQVKVYQEVYQERRDAMLESLTAHMPPGVTWTYPRGGFYVWVTLPEGWDAKAMVPRALAHKVAYVPGVGFYADGDGARHMRLSYCYPSPERIREGVRRLAGVLEEEAELRETFGALDTRPHRSGGRTASRGSEAPDPGTV